MLNWADRFNICCFLDDHQYGMQPHTHECLLGAGAIRQLSADAGHAFDQLRDFSTNCRDWLFGHLGYDLKNETEQLTSAHADHIQFPDLFFFVPETVIQLRRQSMVIACIGKDPAAVFEEINSTVAAAPPAGKPVTSFKGRFTKEEYVAAVQSLQKHILRGDCYEINFCQEFFAGPAVIDPLQVYQRLTAISPNPFTAFYKTGGRYLLCASPERYLKKTGQRLLSQPIKGTGSRDVLDAAADENKKRQLLHSAKDRAENVMIVDLVRNDLSRICEPGSVKVDELFGVYSFPQVHQMISTVSGQLKSGLHWTDAVRATFPMGSMTGAPKKRVMELIEQYERTRRGLFSGAVGYVTPGGDFDFNVVIRSILYNEKSRYLSYQVGSGITFYSDALSEYEECLLKAQAIRTAIGA